MSRPSIWVLLFSLVVVWSASPAVARDSARIDELTLAVDRNNVGVSFFVKEFFSPKIEETIQNGIPVTVTFVVRLQRAKALWKDKRLAQFTFTREIHYDNIKKVYEVFLRGPDRPVVFESFDKAKERLARVDNVTVIPWEPLVERKSYIVSVKAEMKPAKLPFRLQNLLFFVPSGKIETDWYRQRFKVGFFVVPGGDGAK
jgi:hypothetical protein